MSTASLPLRPVLVSGPASAARDAAWQRFAQIGLPTRRDESWKYTDLTTLAKLLPELTPVAGSVDPNWLAEHLLPIEADRLVFIDGRFAADRSAVSPALAECMGNAPASSPAELRSGSGALANLNLALADDGLRLTLAAGIRLPRPVYTIYASSGQAKGLSALRSRIQLGDGAQLRLIEHFLGTDSNAGLTSVVCRGDLGRGARIDRLRLQEEAPDRHHLAQTEWTLQPDAELTEVHVDLGGRLVRQDTLVDLAGTGAAVAFFASGLVQNRQHLDHHLSVLHTAPGARSRIQARGVVDDRARSVFNGRIRVERGAQQTDSEQLLRNLLLSDTAEADSKPELEIYADDVKCAHGATVGQLDEVALFYLRSRGIDADTARSLLTISFAEEILQAVREPELREILAGRIEDRLRARLGIAP